MAQPSPLWICGVTTGGRFASSPTSFCFAVVVATAEATEATNNMAARRERFPVRMVRFPRRTWAVRVSPAHVRNCGGEREEGEAGLNERAEDPGDRQQEPDLEVGERELPTDEWPSSFPKAEHQLVHELDREEDRDRGESS